MHAHRIASIARTAIVAAAIGTAVAIGAAGNAAATTDDQFVSYVTSTGITVDSPRAVLTAAHNVCAALGEGESAVAVGKAILAQNHITTDQAAKFIVASVNTYCPQYGDQLHA